MKLLVCIALRGSDECNVTPPGSSFRFPHETIFPFAKQILSSHAMGEHRAEKIRLSGEPMLPVFQSF
jgi:hypothetical protein